ncbi:MAG: UDP-N-acetylmuramoyl-L-alanine--D-glutamate ligase [Acidimicrobiia bacterium]
MRVLVVGLRATGAVVTAWLRERGDDVTVVEEEPGQPGYAARLADARARGAVVIEGSVDWATLCADADLLVPSPGVRPDHPAMRAARAAGIPIRGDLDLAVEAARVPVVVITGTNGKSTVTSLVSEMLERSGRCAPAVGNIGRVALDAVDDDVDVLVVEASSFQLHTVTATFAPAVAVLLNLAEDHLDWHGSYDAYVEDKTHAFAHQRPDQVLVLDVDDPEVVRVTAGAPAQRVPVSLGPPPPGGLGWRGDTLVDAAGTEWLRAPAGAAPHDRANLAAATAAVRALGARPDATSAVAQGFARLHHRTEPVGKAGGVLYVDDSKATNPHAALAAVQGFDRVVLIAGGVSKGVDLTVLRRVADRLRAVVAIGDRPEEVEAAFTGVVPTVRAASMAEAVERAAAAARPGDTVLLSPACASFDWYDGYEARGDDFRRAVLARTGGSRVDP